MQRLILVSGWAIALLASLAGAAFFISLFVIAIRLVPAGHEGDLGTWAGALFAGLAFVGTIVIATRSSTERKEQERSLAMLTLAGLEPELRKVYLHISNLESAVRGGSLNYPDTEWQALILLDLETIRLWTAVDLVPLTCLPRKLSLRLAGVAAQIHEFKLLLDSSDPLFNLTRHPSFRAQLLDSTKAILRIVKEALAILYAEDR